MATAFPRSLRTLETDGMHGSTLGLLLAATLLGVWVAWAFYTRVAVYAVTEAARLEVDRAVHTVEAPVSGRVVATYLDLGREVAHGAVLIELETDTQLLQHVEAQTRLSALTRQLEALYAESAKTAQALEEARQAAHVAQFAAQEAIRAARLHARGYLADVDLQRAQSNAQQRHAAADSLRLASSRQQREHQTQERDRQAHLERLRRERTQLEGERTAIMATLERLAFELTRRVTHAPVAGRLGEVAALRPGAFVEEGDILAAVVPAGDLKVVAEFLPPVALSRLRPGQPARLRLDSFHWAQYGSVDATVTSVASEVHNGRVRVELGVITTPTSVLPLQHGLTGALEVEVERITPITMVLRAAGHLLARPRCCAAQLPRQSGGESRP